MRQLIRAIRAKVNVNQERFAAKTGSTPASINRWGNGKTIPNLMAQKSLFEFCTKQGIDLAQLVVERHTETGESESILYHGSKTGVAGSIVSISREQCDFGPAFYMGIDSLQPLTLICGEEKPVFYSVKLDLTGLKVLDAGIDLDWAMFIAYNRRQMEIAAGSEIYEKYAHFADGFDVVRGYIANDRLSAELSNFFNGTILP